MSSTLRQNAATVQAAAADQVVSDITTVEMALRNKLKQTEQLKVCFVVCSA